MFSIHLLLVQGHPVAKALCTAGIQATLIQDSAAFPIMSRVNKVTVGSKTVVSSGGIETFGGAASLASPPKFSSVPVSFICWSLSWCLFEWGSIWYIFTVDNWKGKVSQKYIPFYCHTNSWFQFLIHSFSTCLFHVGGYTFLLLSVGRSFLKPEPVWCGARHCQVSTDIILKIMAWIVHFASCHKSSFSGVCVISPYFHWYITKISVNTVNSSITNCLIKRGRFQKASNVYRWWKSERIDYLCVTSPSSYVTWYCYQYCLCYITCVMWPSPPRLWCCCCCMATRRHCPGAKW